MTADLRTRAPGLPLVVLGWITIAFWGSMAVFPQRIPPLGSWPDLGGLLHGVPEWIRQQAGLDRPASEVVAAMDRELLILYGQAWLKIAAGITSGVLLVRRKRIGRVLACALCAALLGWWMIGQFRMLLGPTRHFVGYWTVTPRVLPWVFVRWVLDVGFYAVTLVMAARHPFSRASQPAPALSEVFR